MIEAQLDADYDSASGFRDAITKLVGDAPARVRERRMLTAQWLQTPIGAMLAVTDEASVHLLEFADRKALPREIARLQSRFGPTRFGSNAAMESLARQLRQYFTDGQMTFDIEVVQQGSPFEHSVWTALRQVPAGQTRSYGELARVIGRPEAARAVARANGANQVAIIVPCHPIIGADGSLVGYGGKLWRKRWLLEHELRHAGQFSKGGSDA